MASFQTRLIEAITSDDNFENIYRTGPKRPTPEWVHKVNLNYMFCNRYDVESYLALQNTSPICCYLKWAFLTSGITTATLALFPVLYALAIKLWPFLIIA